MGIALDEITKLENLCNELQILSQPAFDMCRDDEQIESIKKRGLDYFTDPLVYKDKEYGLGLAFSLFVGEPIRRCYVYWSNNSASFAAKTLQQSHTYNDTVMDSKEIYDYLVAFPEQSLREFLNYVQLDSALRHEIEKALKEKSFEAFNHLLLQYGERAVPFTKQVSYFRKAFDYSRLFFEERLTDTQYELAHERLEKMAQAMMQGKPEDYYASDVLERVLIASKSMDEKDPKSCIAFSKAYYFYVARLFYTGHFDSEPRMVREIFEKLVNHPLFPEYYEEHLRTSKAWVIKVDKLLGASAEGDSPNGLPQKSQKELPPMKFPGSARVGRPEEYWMVEKYAKIPRINEKFSKKLKYKIWDPLFKVLTTDKVIIYPASLQNEKAYNALCASLIFHAAEQSGIAKLRYVNSKGESVSPPEDEDNFTDVELPKSEVSEIFDESQDLPGVAAGENRRRSKNANLRAINAAKISLRQEYFKKGGTAPTPKWATVFPSSYEECLDSIGVTIGHGTPTPYLKMLNYWLGEYIAAEKRKTDGTEEEKMMEDEAAMYIRDSDCRKDIQSKQELLKENLHKFQELLDSLKIQLPEYCQELE